METNWLHAGKNQEISCNSSFYEVMSKQRNAEFVSQNVEERETLLVYCIQMHSNDCYQKHNCHINELI